MQLMGGLEVQRGRARVDLAKCFSYKGMMYSGGAESRL